MGFLWGSLWGFTGLANVQSVMRGRTKRPDMQVLAPTSPRRSAAYQLTPVWERVVRTKRLPAEVDPAEVFEVLRRRLRDPEKEVRQHALRVLADIIPVVRPSLDARVSPLLPDLLVNLGHPAPAVRQGALDALRIYLLHSEKKEDVLQDICTKCSEKNSISDSTREDVVTGLIIAFPSLLVSVLRYAEEPARAISAVIKCLTSKLLQAIYQEVAMKSLLRIKHSIGPSDFNSHIENLDENIGENFRLLCEVYDDRKVDYEKSAQEVIEDQDPSVSVGVDNSEQVPNGKVILETEFAFDSDTAITMTILEEEMKTNLAESEDDTFDYTTYNKSLVKVLTDSEQDDYEAIRRTPRRVRFGGEVIKMRTPDSDNIHNSDPDLTDDSSRENLSKETNNEDDSDATIQKKKKAKSMIPLPMLPSKSLPKPMKTTQISKKKSKSLNDLSEYCKAHFHSLPPSDEEYRNDKANSDEESDDHHQQARKLQSPLPSPRRVIRKTFKDNLEIKGFPADDLSSGQSGNSSTGSGSSSENAFDEFNHENQEMMANDVYRDLFKTGDDRAVIQALEKLTREVTSSAAGAYGIEPNLGAIAARLSNLGVRGRTGVAAGGLLRAIIRSVRPTALKTYLPRIATAITTQESRAAGLVGDLIRRLEPEEVVDVLLNQGSGHWKSSKMRAGALRVVAHLGKIVKTPGSVNNVIGSRAAKAAANSCRHPRRRVRAAALDALAALAHLVAPRAVLAALHYEASDRNDGDQLYDAVFARLCRSEVESRRPAGAYRGATRGAGAPQGAEPRPDLAWVMAGSGSASPPSGIKYVKKLESNWPRSAPDLPTLVDGGIPNVSYSYSAMRKPEQSDRIANGMVETRVLTAPPAGVTLRPLVLQHVQHSAWPRQGLAWPQQPAPPWSQNGAWSQQAAWGSASSSWGGAAPGSGGGSWPQRRPPPQLRALTPPPSRPKLQPLPSSGSWNSHSQDDEVSPSPHDDDFSSQANIKNQLEITRDREGPINRSPKHVADSNVSPNHQYKIEESEDTLTIKSENRFINGDVISSPRHSPASRESRWRAQESPPSPPRMISQESVDDDMCLNYSGLDNPPMIEDDFDDDPVQDGRRTRTPSTAEMRFVQDASEDAEMGSEVIHEYNNEERFINMKIESPAIKSNESPNKLELNDVSSVRSAHSQELPNETEKPRTPINTPAVAYLGSSISPDEDVKSTGSAGSAVSAVEVKAEIPPISNGDVEQVVLVNKISPAKKTPKKTLPKALSSKLNRNKVQPVQTNTTATVLPFEKPKEALTRCMNQIESPDWEIVMSGLQGMGRLVKCHPALMETHLTLATRAIANQARNLRSQVARAACNLAGEMFVVYKKGLEQEAEELAVPLLHRTADTNKFLRIDANAALDRMCESITPQKSIGILLTRGTVHQNAIVRCTSARLLATIAKTHKCEKMFSIQKELRDKLLQTGADLLTEGSQETRGYAKEIFIVLSQNNHFRKILRDVIPVTKYRNIEKTLNSLRM